MKTRRTILNSDGRRGRRHARLRSHRLAGSGPDRDRSRPASTSQGVIAAPAPGAKKPTSATPAMIDEAIQRSQARTAKAAPTATSAGTPEQFGSEEPFTYRPGATAN